MNCEAYFELISGHVDGQNDPAQEAALQAHLSVCPACRETLALLSGLETQTAALQSEAPPALKPRVMEAIRKESAKQKRRRWLGPGAGLGAIAAVLALLLGTGVIRLPQRSSMQAEARSTAARQTNAAYGAATEAPATEAAAPEELDGLLTAPADPDEPAAEDALLAAGSAENGAEQSEAIEAPAMATAPVYNYGTSGDGLSSDGLRRPNALRTQLTPEDNDYCAALSEAEEAPVVACCGLDEDFPDEIAALEPTLGERLQAAPKHDADGRIVLELDVDTLFALQEWLLLNLPAEAEADEATVDAEKELPLPQNAAELDDFLDAIDGSDSVFRRLTEFDPTFSCMTTLIEFDRPALLETLPADWPEDFAACFRAQTNWALFYPSEDYRPTHGAAAWLVLIPATDVRNTADGD